jgi:hypothetical protein
MSLSLRAAAGYVADYRNPYEPDEDLNIWQRDLAELFGVPFEEARLASGRNIGFTELAEHALRAMPVTVLRPDMIVVAHGLPDWRPFNTMSVYLDYLLGTGARNFAVSEQGLRAPFTALRIGDAYARSGRCRSLALLVVEQTTLAYHLPLVHDTPLTDSAALFLFGAAGEGTWDLAGGRPGTDAGTLIRDAAAGLPADDVLVVGGPWVDQEALAANDFAVHRVESGSYCTSVWLALAREHERWAQRYRALVLCDTDPRTGQSQAVLLRTPDLREART